MRLIKLLPLALAGAIAAPALAQTIDLQLLREITDAKLLLATGGVELGEIDDVLIDETGQPVAVAVDVDEDVVDLEGEDGRVFLLADLVYQNGNYVTGLTPPEIQALPPYDD